MKKALVQELITEITKDASEKKITISDVTDKYGLNKSKAIVILNHMCKKHILMRESARGVQDNKSRFYYSLSLQERLKRSNDENVTKFGRMLKLCGLEGE